MGDAWIALGDRLPQVGMEVQTRAYVGAPPVLAWRFTGFPGWSYDCEWFTEGERGTAMIAPPHSWRPAPKAGGQP